MVSLSIEFSARNNCFNSNFDFETANFLHKTRKSTASIAVYVVTNSGSKTKKCTVKLTQIKVFIFFCFTIASVKI